MSPRRKSSLKPIEDEIPTNNEPLDANHISINASLDDYEKVQISETVNEFSDKDKEGMAEEINNLRLQNGFFEEQIKNLTFQLKEYEKNCSLTVDNKPNDELVEKCSVLENENDELLLKNSELCYDNHQLMITVQNLQQQLDSYRHTYTNNGYTSSNRNNGNKTFRVGNKFSTNGYQVWC